MRRDLLIKSGNLAGTSDFRVLAPIKKGLVPSLDAVTYKTRVKRVLRTVHAGRKGGFEYEFARVLSDSVERVGRIHSVGIAVLEPEDKILLTVTFDGAWESYIRVIWQKVSRLLDLVFCNTEDYVLGWENSYEKWGVWLKKAQSEAYFLYTTPGLTVEDTRYLRMQERVYRREAGDSAKSRVTQIRIPTAEEIAEQSIFVTDGLAGIDPTNAGFGKPLRIEEAGRPPFRQGVRSVVGLYRLADLYLPGTPDGRILHGAAYELLPEFMRMLHDGNTYQVGIKRALRRFDEATRWIFAAPYIPPVRQGLPVPLPDQQPLQYPGNVQGGILRGYRDVDLGCLLLLQFASPAGLAALLRALTVTWEANPPEPGQIATNIAFTVEGLRVAGLSDDEIRELPEEFVQGMERRAGLLGDLRINHPRRWRLPARNWGDGVGAQDIGENDPSPRIDLSAVHAMVQVRLQTPSPAAAVKAKAQLMDAMKALVAAHADVKPLSLQWMQRQRNEAGKFEEHFGFVDSDSDPVLSRNVACGRFPNQIHLGDILCGYPNLADKAPPFIEAPDRVKTLLQDGSFLVIRKLRQDIAALESCLSDAVKQTKAAGHPLTREELMARMMGRRPGGQPNAGEALADADPQNSNNFNFDNDPHGTSCPVHAHIRRANPRTTDPAPGSRPPRIVRRGMSYGLRHDRKTKDAQALQASLDQERGLIFMTYNASLGEQFELVQQWLNGGNSSGSYSGQGDPLSGLAESGRRRYFRFEHGGQTIRMALDGSDRLHDEPRPFVRLEWGAYLLAPSRNALSYLQERAAAQGDNRSVLWSAEAGEDEIVRLLSIEANLGQEQAIIAWKSALEDPDAGADFITASIWAAIRERHGGVLRTPFAILVADRYMVDELLLNRKGNLSVRGYLPRMDQSFGEIYLGLDAGPDYQRDSGACNDAIMALDQQKAFKTARATTHAVLQVLVDAAIGYATADGDPSWDLTMDAREILDPLLGKFCEEWFGLSTVNNHFRSSGYRWDWQKGEPPTYPGHFLAPSRYFFQPRPGEAVEKIGKAHGVALRTAMLALLRDQGAQINAPVARAILDSAPGHDLDFAARTLVGAVIGFVPTVNGNILRVLNEWLREGTLWRLRARLGGTEAADLQDAFNRLGADFIAAMQLRTAPETVWRTAIAEHPLGAGDHQVAVKSGDVVVAAVNSATQQNLQNGRADLHHAFGGDRRAASHPTHACPGKDPAIAMMLGFFSALVESELALRAGPGPLTLAVDGRMSHPAENRLDQGGAYIRNLERRAGILPEVVHAFEIRTENILRRATTTPLAAIGDSWLFDYHDQQFTWNDLVSSLRSKGFYFSNTFATPGRLLAEMANETNLREATEYLASPGPNSPKALLIGGGGNDLIGIPTKPAPLFDVLFQLPPPADDLLVEETVHQFIDVKLSGYYKTIIDAVRSVTPIPILIHGYDHPVPDGRPLRDPDGHDLIGPWLQPIFVQRGYKIPIFPNSSPDLILARGVMRSLIDRLNVMIARVAASYPKGNVVHVDLRGTLADYFGSPENYARSWDNELHANKDGFDLLAEVVAEKLRSSIPVA